MLDTVLIVAQKGDAETATVASALSERGKPATHIDLADFPLRIALVARAGARWRGILHGPSGELRLESVLAVYYRRAARFAFPSGMSGPERRFAEAEARVGVGGLFASLSCLWVNHPSRVADAEYKPLQLQMAADCEMRTPRTLLTNDARAAREFADGLPGPMVYKPLSGGVVSEKGELRMIYTTLVEPRDFDERQVRLTAHLFQEWVDKSFDARVTVVGERIFAVAVHAATPAAHVDWRRDYAALDYEVIDLPDHVRYAVLEYLRRLGLAMGAFDFAVTATGDWVFLECNPQGLWGWLEEATGVPIAKAVADLLLGGES